MIIRIIPILAITAFAADPPSVSDLDDYNLYHNLLWMDEGNRSGRYAPYDECGQLCDEFSETRRGNGANLCTNDTSTCYFNTSRGIYHCSYLYWSRWENITGLIYETDSSTLTPDELNAPVTCQEAEDLIHERRFDDDLLGDLLQPVYNLDIALPIFVNSEPIQRRLLVTNGSFEGLWFLLHEYANGNTNSIAIREHLGPLMIDSVSGALGQLAIETNTVDLFASHLSRRVRCHNCTLDIHDNYLGGIPISYRSSRRGETIDLWELLRSIFLTDQRSDRVQYQCPECAVRGNGLLGPISLNETSELVVFTIGNSEGISIPLNLNLSEIVPTNVVNSQYRLYAVATDTSATIRGDDEWFTSVNGTSLALVAPVTGPLVSNSINLVLYQRIESY
jgi:hypothetical protein